MSRGECSSCVKAQVYPHLTAYFALTAQFARQITLFYETSSFHAVLRADGDATVLGNASSESANCQRAIVSYDSIQVRQVGVQVHRYLATQFARGIMAPDESMRVLHQLSEGANAPS